MSPLRPLIGTALATLLLGSQWGCFACPDGTLKRVDGVEPVQPGAQISLALHYDETLEAGPERCVGYWTVNGVVGGDPSVGTIDACGHYTAPLGATLTAVEIEGARYAPDACADCCPYATRRVALAGP